jgi:DNA-binding CsgD family transcriptional regulator
MKLFFRLSATIVYLFGIYYVLGKDFTVFISIVDILSLLLGSILFFFLFYFQKNSMDHFQLVYKKAIFWSGFFISIIHLLSLFEESTVYTTINKNMGLVYIILLNCRPLLYAISILILLYSNDATIFKNDTICYSEAIQQLTNREKEIAQLIAQGKTNIEIAEQLFISPFTVKKHVYNIFAKLQISQRMEIKYLINVEKTTN